MVSLRPALLAFSFTLCLNCADPGRAQDRTQTHMRVASYNVQWFGEDAAPERIANLKSVLANLKADIVGLQEIQGKKALGQIFDSSWQIGLADLPAEDQELAVAVRRPYVLVEHSLVFPGPNFESAFPGGRDVLRAVVESPAGGRVSVYVVHMKSRRGGRLQTDPQREAAAGLLAAFLASRRDEGAIVLGDFNDAPDDRSLSILETGDLLAEAGAAPKGPALLANLADPVWAKDGVSYGLNSLYTGRALPARVPGARPDNARLRGQDYVYPDDVKVRQILFDQVLASPRLVDEKSTMQIYSGGDALQGRSGRKDVVERRAVYTEKGDLASDHLPVYADIPVPKVK